MRKEIGREIEMLLPMVASVGLFVLGAVSNAQPRQEHECTQDSLEGDYGYVFTGAFVGIGPVAAVGLASFDGAGSVTASDTISDNGIIGRRIGAGTYTVNVNCTGSAEIGDDFGKLAFDFMIVPGSRGAEFSFIVTSDGTVQTGVARKTGPDECTEASLEGTYRVLGAGTNFDVGLISAVGFRVLDGAGHLTSAEDTFSSNGLISHRVGRAAIYSVNPDCTVSEVFEDGLTFDGVIVAGGREAYFVRTNSAPRTVITALYKRKSRHHEDD
jgi:hypothetical protein